jgi:hydroxyacylglutathione hydrolase
MKAKPKITELMPNIFQIFAERPGCHVYLIKGVVKNLLIDVGTAANFSNLKDCLTEAGLQPSDIHLVVLTHEHFDHIGAGSFLSGTAVIAAHRLAANKIHLQDQFVMMSDYFDRLAEPFNIDISLDTDALIELGNYRLRIIHTPGHTSGCLCLYEPEHKLLFTGDTVLAKGVLSGVFSSGSISDYVMSLHRLNELRVEGLYPGHGKISTCPPEDLKLALENARTLLAESKMIFEELDTQSTFERLFLSWRSFPFPRENRPKPHCEAKEDLHP